MFLFPEVMTEIYAMLTLVSVEAAFWVKYKREERIFLLMSVKESELFSQCWFEVENKEILNIFSNQKPNKVETC